jgi:hypothetical protein
MGLRKTVTALALICGIVTAAVMIGGGATLLAIPNSGERGNGALVVLGGLLALALIIVLAFAPERLFLGKRRGVAAIAAGLLAALPTAVLALAAFRFVRLPIGSPVPALDWPLFAMAIVLACGAAAIAALGYRRAQQAAPERAAAMSRTEADGPPVPEEEGDVPVIHMQQIRSAQQQLRSIFESELQAGRDDQDEEVKVRRV